MRISIFARLVDFVLLFNVMDYNTLLGKELFILKMFEDNEIMSFIHVYEKIRKSNYDIFFNQ